MNYLRLYNAIKERLVTIEIKNEEEKSDEPKFTPVPCNSPNELINYYKSVLEWTQDIEFTLFSMAAVCLSTSTTGGQLGLRVIGPPGSVKSTLAESMSHSRKYVYPRSKFTGIVSGWSSLKKSKQTANKMNGKCVLIKDADTMLQMPNLKQIESEIRDALGDGVIRTEYRTGLEVEIYSLFTMVLCGTKALRRMDDAILGSRFVDVVIHDSKKTDSQPIVKRAIRSQFATISEQLEIGKQEERTNDIKDTISKLAPPMMGFLEAKHEQLAGGVKIQPLTDDQEDRIYAMGELVSYCRAKVERNQKDTLSYRPEKELGTRLAEQFIRLLAFLSITLAPVYKSLSSSSFQKDIKITKKAFAVLRKVVADTCYGFNYDIIQILYKHDKRRKEAEGMPREAIAVKLGLSSSQTWNLLQDLQELDIVGTIGVSNPHGKGRKAHYYVLKPYLMEICKKVLG